MKRLSLVLGLVLAAAGCVGDGHSPDDGDESHVRGDIALGLSLPDGSNVATVDYVITHEGAEVRSGSMQVGADGRASVTVGGLEAGPGYHVKLTAARDAGSSCLGEADFTVVERQTIHVDVLLQCDDTNGDEGNVTITGSFNFCPKASAWTVSPATVAVGSSATVSFIATDRDGDTLSYAWTAKDGTISTPNAASTSYTCTSAGEKELTVTFTDGPQRGCTKTATVTVSCGGGGGGTPDGGIDGGSVDGSVANIQILAFNDFHGNIEPPTGSNGTVVPGRNADGGTLPAVDAGGGGYFARHIADLRAQNPNTVVVSAGDLIGASPLASALFHDEPTINLMNEIGLDFNAVGNHEFDDGRAELLRMQNGGCAPEGCANGVPFTGAKFKFLAANVKTESGETLFPRYAIKEIDGVKIAFIGMTLEATPQIVTPSGIAGLTFYDEADTVNLIVPELLGQGIKAIVVLVHQGGFQTGGLLNECLGFAGDIVDVVNRLHPEVDLIVSGHTHAAYNCVINDRRVTSALAFGRLVTQFQMGIDRTTQQVVSLTAENKIATRDVAVVPAAQSIVDDAVSRVAPLRDRQIGTATALLTKTNNAAGESPLGDIVADAQRADTFDAANPLPQLALMNPGGVRADINAGPIRYGDAFTTQPFGNGTVAMTLTGEQLKTALEQQFKGYMGQTTDKILYVSSNVAYTWSLAGALGSKVSSVTVDGQPLNPAGSYRVTVNSFLSTGGDGFTTFNLGTDRIGGNVDIDALESYLSDPANNPISPPPQTRVTQVP